MRISQLIDMCMAMNRTITGRGSEPTQACGRS